MKRFSFSLFRRTKISTSVRFPAVRLDLRPYLHPACKGAHIAAARGCPTSSMMWHACVCLCVCVFVTGTMQLPRQRADTVCTTSWAYRTTWAAWVVVTTLRKWSVARLVGCSSLSASRSVDTGVRCRDCLNLDDGKWHNYNDSRVSSMSCGLDESSAYLLFYQRASF